MQPVPADANPQVRSVATSLTQHEHPERLTALVPPPPFSLADYRANPQAYLDEVVPGRAFQSAQPAPGVPELQAVGGVPGPLNPGETVTLTVQTLPDAPVSMTSMDLGSFDDRLPAITVQADHSGLARVHFTATPGVTGRVNIVAASPVASGQCTWRLIVNGGTPFIPVPAGASASPTAPPTPPVSLAPGVAP